MERPGASLPLRKRSARPPPAEGGPASLLPRTSDRAPGCLPGGPYAPRRGRRRSVGCDLAVTFSRDKLTSKAL